MSGPDPARARFFALQLIRWTGAALALAGLLVINRKIDLPIEAGYALFAVGVIDALIFPTLLAKRWKSPKP